MRSGSHTGRGERGFTYIAVLVAVAVLGIGLLAMSDMWVASARRDKLIELDWIGTQFTQAIGSYYHSTPGAVKTYPSNLEELLADHRYVTTRRHLRVVYANPFTGKPDWQLLRAADGKVRGVRAVVPAVTGNSAREFVYQSETN